MANLKELRLRITSVKNTRKITAAMSQIATARLRRAQNAALAARPYGERLSEVVSHLVAGIEPAQRSKAHPLLDERPVQSTLFIALSADRGLCGGFNGNINRTVLAAVQAERAAGRRAFLLPVGNKAAGYFRRDPQLVHKHAAPDLESLVTLSKEVAAEAMAAFRGEGGWERVDRVVLYYNHFVSVLTQQVRPMQVLPFETPEYVAGGPGPAASLPEVPGPTYRGQGPVFEPDRASILAHLIPVAVESRLQQAFFNSIAAEIAARRVAMDAATDNASEMIADLTLEYNRERQAAITKELMEIIGGAEALKA